MTDAPWYTRHPLLKAGYKRLKKARQSLSGFLDERYYQRNLSQSQRVAKAKVAIKDETYDKYIREQLEETLLKKRLKGEIHFEVIPLIDMLTEKHDVTGKDVLCVGCRNRDEIIYFRKKGAVQVAGIDLYSDHPDIEVMDMHDLKYSDGTFDVVYSRHSFEHAFDKRKAAQEFVRVLRPDGVVVIEVPGRYKGGADYNRFDGVRDVLDAFEPHVGEFIRNEYSRKEDNSDKMDIIRLMFHVDKSGGAKPARKATAKPARKSTAKPAGKSAKAAAKPAAKATPKTATKAVSKSGGKTVAKPAAKAASKPTRKAASKPARAAAPKATSKSARGKS